MQPDSIPQHKPFLKAPFLLQHGGDVAIEKSGQRRQKAPKFHYLFKTKHALYAYN